MILGRETQARRAGLSIGSRKSPGPPVIPWSVLITPLNFTESLLCQAWRGTPESTETTVMLSFSFQSIHHLIIAWLIKQHEGMTVLSTTLPPVLLLTCSGPSVSVSCCRGWERYFRITSLGFCKRFHVSMHAHVCSISWFSSHASWAPNTSISSALKNVRRRSPSSLGSPFWVTLDKQLQIAEQQYTTQLGENSCVLKFLENHDAQQAFGAWTHTRSPPPGPESRRQEEGSKQATRTEPWFP